MPDPIDWREDPDSKKADDAARLSPPGRWRPAAPRLPAAGPRAEGPLRILVVSNEGRGATVRWSGLDFTFGTFAFESLVHFRRPPARGAVVQRAALERALFELESFDGAVAEAPETVLLHYARRRRGLRPLRWLVSAVHLLERVDPLRAIIRRAYGEDPLAVAAADPLVHWAVTTHSHVEALVGAGLPRERLTFYPSTTALQMALQPGAEAPLTAGVELPLRPSLRAVAGGVLMAGNHNRDVATLARAAERARLRVDVISDPKRNHPVASPWVAYHDVVPFADFVAAVAHARVLVVPLRAGDLSCGQQTLAIAQHLRTVVVASDVPATRDYVTDGVSGFLVPPEDPVALASAMLRALEVPPGSALVEAGFRRNERDGAAVEALFRRAFLAPP